STNEGLFQVSDAGGATAAVTELDLSQREASYRFPQFLPDGHHFIYLLRTGHHEKSGIYVASLDSKERKHLIVADRMAMFSPPGYLLFIKEGTLFAQSFDLKKLELSGEPFPLADNVIADPYALGTAVFSVSQNGVLAFRSGSLNSRLIWLDRAGN